MQCLLIEKSKHSLLSNKYIHDTNVNEYVSAIRRFLIPVRRPCMVARFEYRLASVDKSIDALHIYIDSKSR